MTETLHPLLQAYFTSAFPERQNAQISRLTCLNNGWESDVYAFTAAWTAGGQTQSEELILRIYPGEDADEKSQREYGALAGLHRVGYPVPRVDRLEREASPFGKPFLIMERVQGESLWGPMFHAAPEVQQRLRTQFCGLHARLHALDWRALVPNPAEYEPDGPYAVIDRQIARWQPVIDALPLPGFQATWAWVLDHRHAVTSPDASAIHWDFHPSNILLKPDGQMVVIDWTGFEISDYRLDLAWTLLLITCNEGERWRAALLKAYAQQAGHPVEGMELFDVMACMRRIYSVVVSLTYGAEKLGMRPGAEAQMRAGLPALRRVYEYLLSITQRPIPEAEALFNRV